MSFLEPRVSFFSNLCNFVYFAQKEPFKVQISTLSTARMKINQILYVIFQPMSQFSFKFWITFHSVSWHLIPLKFSSWNILCFGQKEPIKVQFFRLLRALMKVHPVPHAIFETTRSGFIQILYHCSGSWKINPLYFCSSNLAYFG